MKVRILIKKKSGVLDLEGKAIKNALKNLEFSEVNDVFKGSFIDIDFNGDKSQIESFVQKSCENLLVNEVIETFEYQVLE
jgi:phosphoribosylformylglycinamidine synthase subunit PurS